MAPPLSHFNYRLWKTCRPRLLTYHLPTFTTQVLRLSGVRLSNGRILAYVVSYHSLHSNSTNFDFVVLDASHTNYVLKNLKSSTEYLIGVRARTQAGDGAIKLTQIKSGVPSELLEPSRAIVIHSISRSSVDLEFIPGSSGKTSISRWVVEALLVFGGAHSNQTGWRRVFEKSNAPNATRLVVENLKPFTNYSLRMFAQNVKGISAPSAPTEVFQTLADAPSTSPRALVARLPAP